MADARVEDFAFERDPALLELATRLGDVLDTGVCHMAFFADPDGNQMVLHRRYAPHE